MLSPHIADMHDHNHVLDGLAAFINQGKDKKGEKEIRKAPSRIGDASEMVSSMDKGDPIMARKVTAEANRKMFGELSSRDLSDVSDSEITDNFTYNIFPNFAPWSGFVPNIIYRWRPHRDPDHCLMEVRILMRGKPGEPHPKAPKMFEIGEDEPFSKAAHLIGAGFASVFDQDMANLPFVQEGLKASHNKEVNYSQYKEGCFRHFHETLDKYLSK